MCVKQPSERLNLRSADTNLIQSESATAIIPLLHYSKLYPLGKTIEILPVCA